MPIPHLSNDVVPRTTFIDAVDDTVEVVLIDTVSRVIGYTVIYSPRAGSLVYLIRVLHKLVVQICRKISHEGDSDTNDRNSLQWWECAKQTHWTICRPSISKTASDTRWSRGTYLDDAMTSSRMRRSWAMTQRTLRWTPKARRKSHSWRTWSKGGVHAHRVRTAVFVKQRWEIHQTGN